MRSMIPKHTIKLIGSLLTLVLLTFTAPVLANDDLVIDFGAIGLWARMNDASWLQLSNDSPTEVVTGDVDANGEDDVIAAFASGIFIKRNLGGWVQLHNSIPDAMAVGDLDNNGQDDIVIDFGAVIGLYARMNDTSWLKLSNDSPTQMVTGDIDGSGKDDVIGVFGNGIFINYDLEGWIQLHTSIPDSMAVGDLDNNGEDNLVAGFDTTIGNFGVIIGLYAWMDYGSPLKLSNDRPDLFTTGDTDGNGADDVVATFGSSVGGTWQGLNLGGWSQLSVSAADSIVTGNVNGTGSEDIVASFATSIGGIFVKRDLGPWSQLHNFNPDSIAVGNLDGSPTFIGDVEMPMNVNSTINGKHLNFTWDASTALDHYRISENIDGASGFTVVPGASNIAATATGFSLEIPVHKIDWLNAQYIVEACDAGETNCAASPNQTLALIDSIAATFYVKASNTGSTDAFGVAVSLSGDGNTLAVGAFTEKSNAIGVNGDQTNNSFTQAGAVYVFIRDGASWVQQAYIKASNTANTDRFGVKLSLSNDGNTLAVGAEKQDGNGAVYVFSRTGISWSEQAFLKASTDALDFFVLSLSSDGNTLAVGARYENPSSDVVVGGAVFVFTRSGITWSQQTIIRASNRGNGDQFGKSVSLSGDGNTLAVGAPNEDSNGSGENDNSLTDAGAVYVFTRNGANWFQQAYIKASNPDLTDQFGHEVSLNNNGNTLAVIAYWEGSGATGVNGNQNDNSVPMSGAGYIFVRSGITWSQQAYIKANNPDEQDTMISADLSADGNMFVMGTWFEDSSARGINGDSSDNSVGASGAAYLYTRTLNSWSGPTYIKASNTGSFDRFGYSVSLSDDGNTLAVGAFGEASLAIGVNGNQADDSASSGAVYLY